MSIGNFIPIVCIPRLGINHKASSGPRFVRFNKPTSRVRKLSAFRTLVASQVSLVKLTTGTTNPKYSIQWVRKHFHDPQPRRSEQNNKNRRENKKYQWKNQFNNRLAGGFFRRLAALVAHRLGVDAQRARDAATHLLGLGKKRHESAKLFDTDS